ncbi:hypothetical protein TRL7639_03280 [Falsiruegeria litorea R37]|uniref:Uncharacterized protein n=1 Tax=Falsiruegeria litorea R37 TaxID=1200284 RepID=A0A1Y5TB90_9RHOB|nr:hypothetical protein [Falsiruegeria litorea]SLN59696.1 hypothetical protein TRL7639_03280 [Falsiruegeria litorea R37]
MTPKFNLITLLVSLAMLPTVTLAGNESRSAAYDIGDGLIEVVADFSENAIYWCGVGDYALLRLSKRGNARIYVWRGPAPSTARPGERAVTFGFTPPPGASTGTSFTTDVSLVGNSLSVGQAKRTCDERTASG